MGPFLSNYCILIAILLLINSNVSHQSECQSRKYFRDSFVCVCNSTYCDEVAGEGKIANSDSAIIYSTSLEKDRLTRSEKQFKRINHSKFDKKTNPSVQIKIDAGKKFQTIIGFGGAITDASMKILNDVKDMNGLGDMLFHQYYGKNGISYNLGRVPIASCDFSTTNYSYSEKAKDFELEAFKLSEFEFNRWDFLAKAQNVSNPPLRLFSSPWSAPAWIKKNGMMQGGSFLIDGADGKYARLYAKYFIRFFEEYAKRGVRFWATTIQNEPGMAGVVSWQSMEFSVKDQKTFVQKHLGPKFKENWATKDLKIMVHDDFRSNLLSAAEEYFKGDTSYIDGLAYHWYGADNNFDKVNATYHLKPDKFLLSTEACNAYASEHEPELGYWDFAQKYAHDIIQNLLNGGAGWCDWNVFLDEQGGPNWVGNFVEAPIIVNATGEEFYKQPMYYIMGHFSKFVLPDSIRVDTLVDKPDGQLEVVAFERTDNKIVTVLLNKSPDRSFHLSLSNVGNPNKQLEIDLDKKSVKTIIWKK